MEILRACGESINKRLLIAIAKWRWSGFMVETRDHGGVLLRILIDLGSEYCGNREHHEYELYLDLENIETRARDEIAADQWILRAFPSNHAERILRQCL